MCNSDTARYTIVIDTMPDASLINGRSYGCVGKTDTLHGEPSGGVWSVSNSSFAGVDSIGIVTGVSPGIDTIFYQVSNVCGSSSAEFGLPIYSEHVCDSIDYVQIIPNSVPGSLKVYPNPNTGTFTLLVGSEYDEQVPAYLTNLVGQTIKTYSISTNKPEELNIEVAPGIYFVNVRFNGETRSVKVIVSK